MGMECAARTTPVARQIIAHFSDLQRLMNDATMTAKSAAPEKAQIANTNFSRKVRRMFGFALDSWNNIMVLFLGLGVLSAGIVGVSQYVIIQLQKLEARDAAADFERYKLDVGQKIADANTAGETAKADAAEANKKAEG